MRDYLQLVTRSLVQACYNSSNHTEEAPSGWDDRGVTATQLTPPTVLLTVQGNATPRPQLEAATGASSVQLQTYTRRARSSVAASAAC